MAENKKYNSILVSGRKDETLTYSRYIKDEESGKSVKESLDEKISTTDKIEIEQIAQAVWDKLKNEYLRLDGTNSMKGHLFLNGNTISGVRDIFQNDVAQNRIQNHGHHYHQADLSCFGNQNQNQRKHYPCYRKISKACDKSHRLV